MAENRFMSFGPNMGHSEAKHNGLSSNNTRKDNTISIDNRISERLKIERQKAIETLQRSHFINDVSKSKSISKDGKQMDYLLTTKPFNISDLVTDETINLNINTLSQLSGSLADFKSNHIVFEPNEITGRSTLQSTDGKRQNIIQMMNNKKKSHKVKHHLTPPQITINEILATSFASKARNLCDTSANDNNTLDVTLTDTSSLPSNYDGSVSLPRTADMSYARSSLCDVMDVAGSTLSQVFPFRNIKQNTESLYSSEEFADAEQMQSKLLLDEISWAQQYAAIPSKTISAEAKAKAGISISSISQDGLDNLSVHNSAILKDPNFSVGKFFKIRSDQIRNIFQTAEKAKEKCSEEEQIHKSQHGLNTSKLSINDYQMNEFLESPSKDSDSLSDISYLQSLSALDRALGELNLDSKCDSNPAEILQQDIAKKIFSKCGKTSPNTKIIGEIFSDNKENLDPQVLTAIGRNTELNDTTISFTESILNTNDSRETAQRSPSLSPSPHQMASPKAYASALPCNRSGTAKRNGNLLVKNPLEPNVFRSTSSSNNNHFDIGNLKDKTLTPTNSPISIQTENNNNSSNNASKHFIGNRGDHAGATATSPNSTTINSNSNNNNNLGVKMALNENKRKDNRPYIAISPPPIPDIAVTCSEKSCSPTLLNVNGCHSNTAATSSISPSMTAMGNELTTSGYPPRSLSRCSSTTEFCHQHNKQVPLKVTATELSWFSTRLRKNSHKSMQIKNNSDKRLVIRVEIDGPGFKIYNLQRGKTIALQGLECRSITITFCPTVLGVALGALSFHAPYDVTAVNQPFLSIPLYGYGGEAYISFRNVSQGPLGAPFIPFGDISEIVHSVEHTITVRNKGSLEGFAVFGLESASVMGRRLADIFEISPRELLIPPGEMASVKVILHPKREEFKKLLKKSDKIITLATLRIINGDEANRQRFRRLVYQLTDEDRLNMSAYIYHSVWSVFENENEIVELSVFNEDIIILSDMASTFYVQEISLTVNRDLLNDSIDLSSTCLPDADETVLFRTICVPTEPTEPTDGLATERPIGRTISTTTINTIASSNNISSNQNTEQNEDENEIHSIKMDEVDDVMNDGSISRIWLVKTRQLEFDMKRVEYVVIFLQNISKSRQYFEILCKHQQLLEFRPTDGYLLPQQHIEIKIYPHCGLRLPIPTQTMIFICSKKERIDVAVKLIG